MKKMFCMILTTLLMAFMSVFAIAGDISIEIMGQKLDTQTPPLIIEGRTMVPVRVIFEGVGADVDWNGETKTVTGAMLGNTVVMTVDSQIVLINGSELTMDCAPVIVEGRTYAPARYVAEGFGFKVLWDSENRAVKITKTSEKTTVITTTEATTEEITENNIEETTAEEVKDDPADYSRYSEKYTDGTYKVGKDIPKGEYMLLAAKNKFARARQYNVIDNNLTDDEIEDASVFAEYSYYIELDTNDWYVDVENGALVPIDDVEPLDITRNGDFRVGKDIMAGYYKFKLDENSEAAIYYTKKQVSNYKTEGNFIKHELIERDVALKNNTIISKHNIDIYSQNNELKYDFSQTGSYNMGYDLKYAFSDVRYSFKNRVSTELMETTRAYNKDAKKGKRFTDSYKNDVISVWKSSAENEAEKLYASIAGDIYTSFLRGIDPYNNTSNMMFRSVAWTSKEAKYEYFGRINAQSDIYSAAVSKLIAAESFEDCSKAAYMAESNSRGL